tara:strand:+ start:225 stop:626 length:402 start_codon:yes stop_codon:yes gene_type:complete
MKKDLLQAALESNQESFAEATEQIISEMVFSKMEEARKSVAEGLFAQHTEEVTEETAFVSVISECLENSNAVNVDLPDGDRLVVTEDVASLLSEAHDNLPQELQKSFRETVFESKEKYTSILETIVSGDNDGQ